MDLVVQTIDIKQPIDEVFDVATCQERCLVWRGPIFATRRTNDGPVGVGAAYEHKVKVLGVTVEARPVITLWDPPHRAEIQNRSGPVHYDSTFTFQATAEGTKMTSLIQAETGGVFKHVPDRLVQSTIKRQHQADLETLKELMETETEIKV